MEDLNTSSFQTIFRVISLGLIDYTGHHWAFEAMTPIGEGRNFKVFKQVQTSPFPPDLAWNGEPVVAVKRLKAIVKTRIQMQEPEEQAKLRSLLREVHVMVSMRSHEEVTGIMGFGYDWTTLMQIFTSHEFTPYIVMDYAPHGTLRSFLGINMFLPVARTAGSEDEAASITTHIQESYSRCAYTTRVSMCMDIARALCALHFHGIFHTDVKADNVLIFEPSPGVFKAKLTDFGAALIRDPTASGDRRFPLSREFGNTVRYRSPELDRNDIMRLTDLELCKCDVYSFGAVLYEVVSSYIFPERSHSSSAASLDLRLEEVLIAVEQLACESCPVEKTIQDLKNIKTIIQGSIQDQAGRTDSMRVILQLFDSNHATSIVNCEPSTCGRDSISFAHSLFDYNLPLLADIDNWFEDVINPPLPPTLILNPDCPCSTTSANYQHSA